MNRDLTYLLDLEKTCKTIFVKRLSSQFRQENPNIAWKQIAGMRDKLIHDYNEVDLDLTWEVTQTDIPALLEFILPLLPPEELGHQSSS
jgi:uncharacterized protein with HEPN domain